MIKDITKKGWRETTLLVAGKMYTMEKTVQACGDVWVTAWGSHPDIGPVVRGRLFLEPELRWQKHVSLETYDLTAFVACCYFAGVSPADVDLD